MTNIDEVISVTIGNPTSNSLEGARNRNNNKLAQARADNNSNTPVPRRNSLQKLSWYTPDANPTVLSNLPEYSFADSQRTFGDRHPVIQSVLSGSNKAVDTVVNTGAAVGGLVGDYGKAKDFLKTITFGDERQELVNNATPTYVKYFDAKLVEIESNPNLTSSQKPKEVAKLYANNIDATAFKLGETSTQSVAETLLFGGAIGKAVSVPVKAAVSEGLSSGVNHLAARYDKNGKVTGEDYAHSVAVGTVVGSISGVGAKYNPFDVERVVANKNLPIVSSTSKVIGGIVGNIVEEIPQGATEQASHNILDGKSIGEGQASTAVHSAVLGGGAGAVITAPSAAVSITKDTAKLTGAGIAVAGKTAYDWGKDRLASDAQKEVNKFSKIYHDNLARMGQEADDNDLKQGMEILSGTLNNLAKQRDDLAEKLKTTTDPKQKKKLQKDYDHATKIYEDISAKHEVVQSEYYKSLSPEELTRLFIEKQRTYQYELAMMGGASIPKTPYTASNSPTPSTVNTGTTNNTKTGTGTTNAVIRMGKYQFNNGKQTNAHDVGRGSGDHIDFHVAGKKGVNPTQYTDRFIVADGKYQGKTLQELLTSKSYVPSSQQAFAAQRDGYKHNGIDFDSRIGGGITINPKYQIKSVTAHHNAGGYGHYVQVHFADGISIGLGHMGKANVDAFMQAWNSGGSQKNGYGSTQSSSNTGVRHTGIAGITPAKSVSYSNSDGTTTTKVGGSRAWRTNNAGNLIFGSDEAARKVGAIGRDHEGYAIFATEADGDAARMQVLKRNWGKLTIRQMIHKYAPKDDGKTAQLKGNDPEGYANFIFKKTGLSESLTINQLSDSQMQSLMGAMKQKEGYKAGTITGGDYSGAGYGSATDGHNSSLTQVDEYRSYYKELQAKFEQEENTQRQQELQEQMEQMQARITELETAQTQSNQTQPEQETQSTQEGQTQPTHSLSDMVLYSRKMGEKHIEALLQAGAMTEEEVSTLRLLSKVNQAVNENKNGDTIVHEVYKGSNKATVEESNRGLFEYQERLINAMVANDLVGMDKLADDLYRWEESHTSKAKASQQAWELFESTGKPHTIARQEDSQEWRVYEGEPFTPEQRSQTGAMVIKGFSKNYVQQVAQEAAHIQQMASAYHSVLKNTPNTPVRTVEKIDWIDFDSVNIPAQRVNAHTGSVLTRGGTKAAHNPFEMGTNVPTASAEPVTARTASKIDDLTSSEQLTTNNFKDHNPQVTHRHQNVAEYKQQYANDRNSVWLGRGINNVGNTVSISNFVFSGTRTNKDTGEKEFYNNLVTDDGGVRDGVFGMATNLHDINTKKPSVKADAYNIIHDGTSEGIQSAQIEAVNRFTDMIRLGVQTNYNFANALVYLANNTDIKFHGSNHIGNAYTEATVMRELLPVVAGAIKGYKDPKTQQQRIINALDNIGTMMSDGKYHSEVPRPLQLNDEAKAIHKLQYDNTVVHGSDSLAHVWQGESVSSAAPVSASINTAANQAINVQDVNDLLQDAAQTDILSQEHTEEVSTNTNAKTINNPNNEAVRQAFDDIVNNTDEKAGEQIINENVAPTQPTMDRANGIAVNKAKNANIKTPHKLGMNAKRDVEQKEQAKPALNDITGKVVTAKEVNEVIKVDTPTKHQAEVQSIIDTLNSVMPDMKVRVSESINDTDMDTGSIHVSSTGNIQENLAKAMMRKAIGKISQELDSISDKEVASVAAFDRQFAKAIKDSNADTPVLDNTNKLTQIREDIRQASRKVNQYLREHGDKLDGALKSKLMYVLNTPSDMLHYGLLDNEVKTVFQSIKLDKPIRKSKTIYQLLKDAVSRYLGFDKTQATVYDKLLNAFAGSVQMAIQEGEGVFIKSDEAKLSVFKEPVDIHTEHQKSLRPVKDKLSESKNVLATYFKQIQSKSKPLSSIPNFVNNLVVNPIKAAQTLKLDMPNETQLKQIQDFGLFHHEFKNFLEETVIKKTAGYEYASMASYLVDEHGQVDENLLAAMSYTAYDFIIANGNHIRHTDDEIKQLLGLYDERDREAVYLSKYLRDTYQYRGFVYDIQAQKIGERVAKTLNISANELGSMELDSRLYGALGGWVLSAMQAADLVHITQMSTTKHLSNMALVNLSQANEQGKTVSEYNQTRFVAMSNLKGEGINPILADTIAKNKGTSGYLSDVFGGVSGLRNPLTKAPEQGKVKRSIKKTKAQVADVQAKLVDKAQQEAMVVNESFDILLNHLATEHEEAFYYMLGAKVSETDLNKAHINDRAGMQGAADGIMREFTNAVNFFDGLKKDDEGERKFYDTMFMAVNTRMHLNSNVVNIQSSKLHRAWADHKSYQYEIKNPKDTLMSLLDTLAVKGREATIKNFHENELQLLVFLRALGENMEGSEDFVKAYIKQDPKLADTFIEGFTVDKLPSYIFIPAFMEFLGQPVITQALPVIDKVLNNETISKDEMNQLVDAVKATDMGASGLRALMEWSRFTHHQGKGNFKTSLGLGSDGINNGVMIAHVSSGVADKVMLNRTGLFTHDSDYDTYFDSRHDKGVGDYYTAFKDKVLADLHKVSVQLGTSIKNAKQKGENTSSVQSMLDKYTHIQELFATLQSRKAAKDVLVPVNYASGETSTKLSVYRRFLGDIQSKLSKIANEAVGMDKEQSKTLYHKDVQPLIRGLNIIMGRNANEMLTLQMLAADGNTKELPITEDMDLTLLNESWFDTKTEAVIQESFLDSVGADIWSSLEDYEGGFLESNKRNIAVLTAAAELYMAAYEYHIQKAKETKLQALIDKYKSTGLDDVRANKLAKDELDFIGLSYAEIEQVEQELEQLNPTVHTAHSIQDNDTKAKVRLVNTISQVVSGNSELTQNNFYQMNTEGMLQSTTATSATKKQVMEAQARKVNSIQTQSQDARVASMIMTAGDGVHGNVHDAGITGGKHYYTMAQAQNKAMYETLRDYSTPVESLNTLVDTLSRFKDYMKTHNENADFMSVYIKALAVAMQNEPRVFEGDTQRKHIVSNLKNMHQYGAEFGEYVVTKTEANKTQEIFKKQDDNLRTLKDTLHALALDMGQAVMGHGLKDKAVAVKDAHIIAVGYTEGKNTWATQHKRYDFGGGYLSVNHLDDLSHAQIMQARKLLSPKKLKELDKSRKTDKEAQAKYTQEIVTAHVVNEADAVYLVDSFYENKLGKVVQTGIAKGLLYKAKQQGKPIFANDMNGNWLGFDMVQDDWVMLQAPLYLPSKPLIHNTHKKTAGLNDLLAMVDMNHQVLMDGGLSSITDKPSGEISLEGGQTTQSKPIHRTQGFKDLEVEQQERSSFSAFGERGDLENLEDIPVVTIETAQLGFKDTKKLADEILRQIQKTDGLYNKDTGWVLQVGKKDRKKMGNNNELSHATSQSVQGIEELVTNAVVAETHEDIKHNNPDVIAVHRMYVPALIDGQLYRVKLTVKDYVFTTNQASKKSLHAIEAVEIENSLLGTVPSYSAPKGVQKAQPTTGSKLSIATLLKGVKHDGDDGVFLSKKDQVKIDTVSKTFNINDIKKAVAAREKTPAVGALFNAYMSVVEKHYPNLTLRMVSEGSFNAYYTNGQITINESVWNTLSDNDKVRLINHELAHVVTLTGLEHTEHEAVKDLHKMYDYLKSVYTKGTHTVLDEVFYPTDADGNGIDDKRVGVAELVAYGTENKVVAEFIAGNLDLRKADVKQKNKLGVLEQFYAAVTAMLAKVGFKLPYKTFLARVNEVIELGQESSGTEQMGLFNKTLDDDSTIDGDYDKSLHTIYDELLDNTISDEHSEHLSNLMGKIYSPEYEALLLDEQAAEKYQDATIMYAPTNLFNLSPKEVFAYSALATTVKHLLDNDHNNQVVIELTETVGQMIAHFDGVRVMFPDYDNMSENQKEQANKQYASLFHDVTTDPNKALAHIAGVMMASEDMKDRLNIKLDKTTKVEDKGWFNKAMAAIYKLLNMFRDKYIHTADTSQNSVVELLTKLAKIDADVREGKKNLIDTAYDWVYTKPMDYANHLVSKGLDRGINALDERLGAAKKGDVDELLNDDDTLSKLSAAGRAIVDTIKELRNQEKLYKEIPITDDMSGKDKRYFTEFNKKLNQNNPTRAEAKMASLNMVADAGISLISDNHSKEFAHLLEEMRGIHDNPSYVMERMTAYNTKANNERNAIKENVMGKIYEWFNRELTAEDEEAMTRTLLMTDAQALLDYHKSDAQVLTLIQDKKARAKRVGELITRLEHLIPEQHIREDMIIQSMSLGYYMATETTVPNVLKSAEMIATSVGTGWAKSFDEMDTEVFAAVDELTTLYALDHVKSKYSDKVQDVSTKHTEAVLKVLRLQQANVKDSKQAFADNPLNYTKGYVPAIHDAHTDVKTLVANEVQKYLDEGYEMVQEEPLPQDALDKTEPRYMLVNKNYAASRRVSGALDLKDSHTKGTEIYHYKKDGKALSEAARELQTYRYNTLKAGYKNYDPKKQPNHNLIPVVGTDGMIISLNMEMTGATRDSVLKRDLSLTMLMGTQRAALDVNPQIKKLQSRMADEIVKMVKDPVNGFKMRPHNFTAINRNSSNPHIQEMYKLLPYEFVSTWEKHFGKDAPIVIPKASENLIFGFKKWSVAEWFDKATGERNAFEKLITQMYRQMYGQQAKNKAAEHQRVWEWFIQQAKDVIVIRSIKVLKGNIIANMLMLALQGVPISKIVTDTMYAWREGTRYMKWQNELKSLNYEIMATRDSAKVKELRAKAKKLEFQINSSGIHAYMQEGLMSSIVEGIEVAQESKAFKSDFETRLDNMGAKIPKPLKEIGKQIIMHPDTDTHKFLTKATQFSDMAAKYVLARHVEKQQLAKGKSKSEAFKAGIIAAQDTFLNYDVPTGRGMQALNDLGFFNFTKFTLRFQKTMLKQLQQNTGHTIAQHFLVENLFDTAGVLNPLAPIPNVGWGIGTATSAVTELPVYGLFFE